MPELAAICLGVFAVAFLPGEGVSSVTRPGKFGPGSMLDWTATREVNGHGPKTVHAGRHYSTSADG